MNCLADDSAPRFTEVATPPLPVLAEVLLSTPLTYTCAPAESHVATTYDHWLRGTVLAPLEKYPGDDLAYQYVCKEPSVFNERYHAVPDGKPSIIVLRSDG